MSDQTLTVRVQSIRYEASGILGYELVDPNGGTLPAFTAGAHIDIHLDQDLVRQYSLCGDPEDGERYRIAVLREPQGRGGSMAMHDRIRAGDVLRISPPRNHFPLQEGAARHILLAGGIGVTPMIAMIATLRRQGADYALHYCTRSAQNTAFRDHLMTIAEPDRIHLHHDGGDPARSFDLQQLLAGYQTGTHLYYCGPAGFMQAVSAATTAWPEDTLHREFFSSPLDQAAPTADNRPFRVRLALSDEVFEIPAERTIVDVLREHGIHVDTSCKEGYCGTCMTRYLSGEPEHRDVVLDAEDRKHYVLICCARSHSDELVLDL